METISVESGDIAAVKKTMREIGLEDYENINYVQMIKKWQPDGFINRLQINCGYHGKMR